MSQNAYKVSKWSQIVSRTKWEKRGIWGLNWGSKWEKGEELAHKAPGSGRKQPSPCLEWETGGRHNYVLFRKGSIPKTDPNITCRFD